MANIPQLLIQDRRENGRVRACNPVAIPLDDILNAASEAVAAHIQGAIALPHAYGRLQFGTDLELHFRTMIGTGANPNVAAAKCGESDTTTGRASCPTVGNMYDKLVPLRRYGCFGETSDLCTVFRRLTAT